MTGQVRLMSGSPVLWFVHYWDWLIVSGRGFRERSRSEVTWRLTPGGGAWSVAPPDSVVYVCVCTLSPVCVFFCLCVSDVRL